MKHAMWRLKPAEYKSIRICVPDDFKTFSGREPEYVFVIDRMDRGRSEEDVAEWLEGTGIEHGLGESGNFRFVELYSESDAVMFKLRWA